MKDLNLEQKQAVEYTSGPLLIVAGAGTGKTTVITQKITFLVKQNLAKPEEILALTFTEKAAGEMQERVDQLLDLGYSDMQISTFHAFCQKLLEFHGLDIGLSNQFKLLTPTDAWLLVRKNLDKFNLDYYRPLGNPTRHIHELIKHFSKCKDELITPAEYLKYAEEVSLDDDADPTPSSPTRGGERKRLTEIANAYHTYNQLLLDNNCLDFGDLIFYGLKLLKERPNILKLLQNKYKYILVDEFQDVNYAQYELVKLFTTNGNQLTVVGDDDQSIYAFRGASVSNILRFKDDFPNAKEIVLTENYRSGQEILDLAYKSIQNNNPDRLEIKLNINKQLKSVVSSLPAGEAGLKSEVEYKHFNTSTEEINFVINKICEICKDESVVLSDFAILIRANSQAEPFINAFEKVGLPYEYLASSGLYRQPLILDCINFLKVLDNYHESSAIFRLLHLPFLKFNPDDLQKITYFSKKKSISYYETLKRGLEINLSKTGIEIVNKLLNIINSGTQMAKEKKPIIILLDFLEQSGYFKYLALEDEQGNREIIKQIKELRSFFEEVKHYEESVPQARVSDFLEHYNYILESGDEGQMFKNLEETEAIKILTIHSAKGLEFKYVFVVNLVEERFPSRKRGEAIELPVSLIKENLSEVDYHVNEERRLFYVACTRAKEKLFLTSADDYGGVRKKKVSRFIDELNLSMEARQQYNNVTIDTLPHCHTVDKKDINQSKSTTILSDTFSYSQINSYLRCPYQYKLAHVLKIPTTGNASFSFGSTIHNTLQKFYNQVIELNSIKQDSLFVQHTTTKQVGEIKVPTLDNLLKFYKDSWQDDWYQNKQQREEFYKKGHKILEIFYSSEQKNGWTVPVFLESGFKIKIGDYFINGRIDHIDKLSAGALKIIDYKTGKAKEKVVGDDKNQLLIYQIAAEILPEYKNIGPVSELTFYYLEENLTTSFVGDDKDKTKLQEKIIKTIGEINDSNFVATPSEHICQHCDFRDICQFRQL
ncbi:MAG: hypothetical protein US42_C0002G0050 [Candidatus Magasanikbacteria bacterium GW2011_GWC2_37_14]|uniref:DNA 3'-5' helicase n=1 Tax=Candidatus Magasanikbacteria bacterium GW2011_GWC2_37_14 TaxID=1619046 RepID=A0A0G0GPN2_9BACT|nr:MAG: hypothetical protein US42_C0002G0050 [Candidatus Magasanikbacteria bacterium GW2011_GWC2_37_14]